ncbi:hypothetical protein POJ06DRAFT_143916 [Lipomyces tetrasporus]|uniref:K Homology domain-containing protein n=1 Tax=Lipomyces tetrasporus TaxID=54092 RepID=A0AAD7QP45_9ASCO|nr:uncharacterized protein POJ06DRAFT_143916 [Lipomyces tetrasporus]KAJ8098893.1 hypothetical protein POJ06DRAFT_143916 [Lipomyces tetrasporus]
MTDAEQQYESSKPLFEKSYPSNGAAEPAGESEPQAADTQQPQFQTDEAFASAQLTLRALVSSKEAGVIIGKQGKNVADLREATGVKAGVSKPVPGVHDRVLSVTGTLEGVAKAYSMAAQTLIDSPPPSASSLSSGTTSIRLLISHNQMGTIIGRQGLKIKSIQDECSVRMVASKEMLPNSTERIVEVQGAAESIRLAVWEIGKCLVEDWQRATGTILYNPQPKEFGSSSSGGGGGGGGYSGPRVRTGNPADFDSPDGADQTQNIAIPADMVGCIIGRGGAKIQEIRRVSGARISIAKQPHDESGERMFTIRGTADENERALFMLYEQLEHEKVRRQMEDQEQDE